MMLLAVSCNWLYQSLCKQSFYSSFIVIINTILVVWKLHRNANYFLFHRTECLLCKTQKNVLKTNDLYILNVIKLIEHSTTCFRKTTQPLITRIQLTGVLLSMCLVGFGATDLTPRGRRCHRKGHEDSADHFPGYGETEQETCGWKHIPKVCDEEQYLLYLFET